MEVRGAEDTAWLQVWHHAWGRVGMSQFFKAALLRLAMQAEKVGQQGLEVEQPTQHTHRVVVQMTLQLGQMEEFLY